MPTYVMSDIHGQKARYDKAMELIGKDRVYILGDAIDRGPDGLEILDDIRGRENVTFLIGNHEDFLLRYLSGRTEHNLVKVWTADGNGGKKTLQKLKKRDAVYREGLREWLETRQVCIRITVGEKDFLLGHAATECAEFNYDTTYRELLEENPQRLDGLLWNSMLDTIAVLLPYRFPLPCSCIVGHRMVQLFTPKDAAAEGNYNTSPVFFPGQKEGTGIYGIDGGCAICGKTDVDNCLILMRLDDMKTVKIR